MTAGSSILKNFSWPLKSKKRARSGSGGSWDLMENKKKTTSTTTTKKRGGRKISGLDPTGSSLEIVAPASSDVEFKYSWPIDSFVHQVKSCRSEGIDSKPFDVNVNGVLTTWTLSVRFWVGENGERLSNPFVLCLNLVNCKIERSTEVSVKYKFGIYNRVTEEPEMGPPERVTLKQENCGKLQSIGYKNIAMNEKHVNSWGDVLVFVRLSIIREEEAVHSLSSDLGSLINDEKSSDLILEAGERKFMVHRNILAARSPVFADLLARMEEEKKDGLRPTEVVSPESRRRRGVYSPPSGSVINPFKLSNIEELGDVEETNIDIHTENTEDQSKSKLDRYQTKEGETSVAEGESDVVNQPKNPQVDQAVADVAQINVSNVCLPNIADMNSDDEDLKKEEENVDNSPKDTEDTEAVESNEDVITKLRDEKHTDNLPVEMRKDAEEEDMRSDNKLVEEDRRTESSLAEEDRLMDNRLREDRTRKQSEEDKSKNDVLHDEVKRKDKFIQEDDKRKNSVLRDEERNEKMLPDEDKRKDSVLREEDRALKKLVIDDLPGDTVEQLLKYIYTDSSHNLELFSQTLLAASDRYKLPGLKQHCEKHLGEIMSPVNVADILLLSDNYSCKDLKKAALTYCSENHSYIMKDSKWKTIERDNPLLFAEAIALVAPDTCDKHAECIKKGGNRYEAEKSAKGSLVGRKKSHTRKL